MAGGCPLLRQYTTPGERLRGCSFAEGFASYSDLVRNSESITGSPTIANGVCTFNGSSAVVYKRHAPGNDISVSVWFKASSLGTSYNTLISSGIFSTGNCLNLFVRNNGELNCDFYVNGVGVSYTTVPLGVNPTYWADNNWHNVILVISRTGNFRKVYYDGVQVLTGALSSTVLSTTASTYALTIGAQNTGGFANFFTGQIRDVKIWDQALDVAEAQAYYNGTMFNYEKRIKVYYPMRAQDHDVANSRTLDVSGNGYHGVQSASVPTKMSTRGYTYAINQQHLSPVISASDQARTLFWAFKNLGPLASAIYGPACVLDPPGYSDSFGVRIYVGQVQLLHNNAGSTMGMFPTSSPLPLHLLCVAISAPSGGSCIGQAMLDFNSINLTGILRAGNDSRIGTNGYAGLTTSAIGDCLSVGLWHEQLNKTQMAEFQAKFLKQVNDV